MGYYFFVFVEVLFWKVPSPFFGFVVFICLGRNTLFIFFILFAHRWTGWQKNLFLGSELYRALTSLSFSASVSACHMSRVTCLCLPQFVCCSKWLVMMAMTDAEVYYFIRPSPHFVVCRAGQGRPGRDCPGLSALSSFLHTLLSTLNKH